MLNPDMPPEAKNFFADDFLETIYERKWQYHCGYADGSGCNGQPDNESGKRLLPVKRDPFSYEERSVQSAGFNEGTNVQGILKTFTAKCYIGAECFKKKLNN